MPLTQPCLPLWTRACLGVLWFLISVLWVAVPSALADDNAEELFVRRLGCRVGIELIVESIGDYE